MISTISSRRSLGFLVLAIIVCTAAPAAAVEWNFRGSLGENGHDRYVAPLGNPVFNETPYITTEARLIYLHNEMPGDFVRTKTGARLTNGGSINIYALQLRLALTNRLGIIATKDGYADIDFNDNNTNDGDGAPLALSDETGFANLALGVKYAVYDDPAADSIVSVGLRYEAPSGNLKSDIYAWDNDTQKPVKTGLVVDMQGHGDGLFDMFVTGATVYDKLGLQGSLGFVVPLDDKDNSSMMHYSAHADYEALPGLFPLIEVNGYTTIDSGNRLDVGALGLVGFEGQDLVNFGTTDSGTVITVGAGARYAITDGIMIGAGYEGAVTGRQDHIDWRINADLIAFL